MHMRHLEHLRRVRQNLQIRSEVMRLTRQFFWNQSFVEIDAPTILRLPGQEPYLSPMRVTVRDDRNVERVGYLHTSPEYTMKKMLAAGEPQIFSMQKVFRDNESFGGTHNPEFMMIEWYRAGADYWAIMDDTEALFVSVAESLLEGPYADAVRPAIEQSRILRQPWARLHMRDIWRQYANVDLEQYLTQPTMLALCREKGYPAAETESFADLFYRIFLNEIEPYIGNAESGPVFVYGYPAEMAALARLAPNDPRYAQRFELYVAGMELANAFGELTDHHEQLRRLEVEREERRLAGKDVYAVDSEFIDALRAGMPESSGIALGIDRMVQVMTGCQNINDVIALPMSILFEY